MPVFCHVVYLTNKAKDILQYPKQFPNFKEYVGNKWKVQVDNHKLN